MAVGLAADMKTANFVTGTTCLLRWIWRTPAVLCYGDGPTCRLFFAVNFSTAVAVKSGILATEAPKKNGKVS
jgi:hypothetical protein